jgi:hypothetical protein
MNATSDDRLEIISTRALNECAERLAERTVTGAHASLTSMTGSMTFAMFCGRIEGPSVHVHLATNSGGVFRREFSGTLTPCQEGTRLSGRFSVARTAFLTGLVAPLIVTLFWFTLPADSRTTPNAWSLFAFGIANPLLAWLGDFYARSQLPRFKRLLAEAVGADSSDPSAG